MIFGAGFEIGASGLYLLEMAAMRRWPVVVVPLETQCPRPGLPAMYQAFAIDPPGFPRELAGVVTLPIALCVAKAERARRTAAA
jgi:hypothetical protein